MADNTSFHRILWDDGKLRPDGEIRRVVLCSGKVYYDLFEEREKRQIDDIYILRVEQLYPWPHKALIQELGRFKNADVVWCQEEPLNMGAWSFAQLNIERAIEYAGLAKTRVRYCGRPSSAATATGLMSKHLKEMKAFIDDAFAS
jgi:2-oxoglutarate dehydrogenase E1 component